MVPKLSIVVALMSLGVLAHAAPSQKGRFDNITYAPSGNGTSVRLVTLRVKKSVTQKAAPGLSLQGFLVAKRGAAPKRSVLFSLQREGQSPYAPAEAFNFKTKKMEPVSSWKGVISESEFHKVLTDRPGNVSIFGQFWDRAAETFRYRKIGEVKDYATSSPHELF